MNSSELSFFNLKKNIYIYDKSLTSLFTIAYHIAPKENLSIIKSLDEPIDRFWKEIDDDEAFMVGDFDRPCQSLDLWEENLPDIKPYYAI